MYWDSQYSFYVTTSVELKQVAEHLDYGLSFRPGNLNKTYFPSVVFPVGLMNDKHPSPVSPPIAVSTQFPEEHLFTGDTHLRRAPSMNWVVGYGDRQIGPTGSKPGSRHG